MPAYICALLSPCRQSSYDRGSPLPEGFGGERPSLTFFGLSRVQRSESVSVPASPPIICPHPGFKQEPGRRKKKSSGSGDDLSALLYSSLCTRDDLSSGGMMTMLASKPQPCCGEIKHDTAATQQPEIVPTTPTRRVNRDRHIIAIGRRRPQSASRGGDRNMIVNGTDARTTPLIAGAACFRRGGARGGLLKIGSAD